MATRRVTYPLIPRGWIEPADPAERPSFWCDVATSTPAGPAMFYCNRARRRAKLGMVLAVISLLGFAVNTVAVWLR